MTTGGMNMCRMGFGRTMAAIIGLLCLLPARGRCGEAGGTAVGFLVCSPGPVSDKVSIELRLGIRNGSASQRAYTVDFYLDRAADAALIHSESVTVGAGVGRLVSHWISTKGLWGSHKLLYRVRAPGSTAMRGEWPIEVFASDTPALPWAQCVWLDPGNMAPAVSRAQKATPSEVRRMVDAMRDIGATFILISYVEGVAFNMGPFYPSKIPELGRCALDFDAIGVVLDQAERNGQRVILGLGRGPDLTLVYDGVKDPARVARALDLGRRVTQELWDRYSRYRSLYGWYLSHEPTDLAAAAVFLNPMADFMHSLAPEKLVVVAPSGTPILSPAVLAGARYDVLTYQDAVGPGYVPYKYTWNPENRLAQLDDVCRAYREAHKGSGKHLWSDTETWEMAGPAYGNPYPAAFPRVLRQMEIARRHFDALTLYEFMATMTAPGTRMGPCDPRSRELYRHIKAHYVSHLAEARARTGRLRSKRDKETQR